MLRTDLILALLALGAATGVTALTLNLYIRWQTLSAHARTVRNRLVRTEAWRAEARRIRAWRQPVADATDAVNDVVQIGASLARVGHGALASVSFGVFNRIPRTRARSQQLQEAHDTLSQSLYRAIETAGEGFTETTRKSLLGEDPVGNE
ncbi:hypothetical protein Back2_02610 [Nocardioides baekrokdamisoli]|uniref:Uncharacterized protein n=1 Tax=Nocardioides baekrokdamisoli TaxID=1804624 RepID=A0A3G9IXS1_9ACTN|nr:hypothetical protein [Nocardioides baekrokdamisoli]BBH15974.1 hypothetical protein Back2_02610 [Nocardioides baekrokdamisoli]